MKSKRLHRKKTLEINTKFSKEKIERYPFVEVHWLDIVGETGWQTFDQLMKSGLGRMVSRGWLVSREKGITRIFCDYGLKDGKEGDEGHIETIGGTTIIPNSVITKIVELK
jgi:hypothetical protein